MPFNILILPLLGGFIFVSYCNYTKNFINATESRFRLLAYSSITGIFLAIISQILISVSSFLCTDACLNVIPNWLKIFFSRISLPIDYLATSLISFFLGFLLTILINKFFSKKHSEQQAIKFAVSRLGDRFDKSMYSFFEGRLKQYVQITMRDGKVYVGQVIEFPIKFYKEGYFIKLLPLMSGYRCSDTKKIIYTTNYADIYKSIDNDIKIDSFLIPISKKDILIVREFREEIKDLFIKNGMDHDNAGGRLSTQFENVFSLLKNKINRSNEDRNELKIIVDGIKKEINDIKI